MKVGIIVNNRKEESRILAREIVRELREHGASAWVEGEGHQDTRDQADIIIVLGGDGTMLRAAREYAPRGIPLVGVNLGQVGFLAELEAGEIKEYLTSLLAGVYRLEERLMLKVLVKKPGEPVQSYLGLNDAVIRAQAVRVVSLRIAVNGSPAGFYRGDGVICSTPTGSTGYSLAAGGPVVVPGLDALVITPINPFAMSARPLVVSSDRDIIISPTGFRPVLLTVDGQVEIPLSCGDTVELTGATVKTRLVKFKDEPGLRVPVLGQGVQGVE